MIDARLLPPFKVKTPRSNGGFIITDKNSRIVATFPVHVNGRLLADHVCLYLNENVKRKVKPQCREKSQSIHTKNQDTLVTQLEKRMLLRGLPKENYSHATL